jgi:hypothetical protein
VARDADLPRDDFDGVMRVFLQFGKWSINCYVQPIALELSLVSELHQYGGTPDCIALINSKISLVEFKTSATPFAATSWPWRRTRSSGTRIIQTG